MPQISLTLSTLLNIVLTFGFADASSFTGLKPCSKPGTPAINEVGMVDTHGKTIVPCKYKSIEDLGYGLFFLENFPKSNEQALSYDGQIVTYNGKPIPIHLPPHTTLARVIFLNEPDKESQLSTLPTETFLITHSDKGFGLADHTGKIILEATHLRIGQPNQHYFPVDATDSEKFVFNAQTMEKMPFPAEYKIVEGEGKSTKRKLVPIQMAKAGPKRFGYARASGYVLMPPVYNEAGEFDDSGLAIVKVGDKKGFVDDSGQLVSPLYFQASGFNGKYAVVVPVIEHIEWSGEINPQSAVRTGQYALKAGFINRDFKLISPPKYRSLTYLQDNLYAAQLLDNSSMDAITPDDQVVFHFPSDTYMVWKMPDGYFCRRSSLNRKALDDIKVDFKGNVIPSAPAEVADPSSGLTVNHSQDDSGQEVSTVVDASGKVVAKEITGSYQIISKDRIIKSLTKQPRHR